MSRKSIIICSIVAVILAVAVALGVILLFSGREHPALEEVRSRESLPSVFCGIPSDAVAVMEFGTVKDLASLSERREFPPAVFSSDKSLLEVVRKVADEAAGASVALSLHYSGYNRISPLCIIGCADTGFYDSVRSAISSVNRKLVCRMEGSYILITDSDVLLETACRHIRENISILDNADFAAMAMSVPAGTNIYVNHPNLGKLFSGAVAPSNLKYAQFFQKYVYWSVLTLDSVEENSMSLSGKSRYNIPDDAYCHIFDKYSPRAMTVYSMVPYYASMVVAMPVPDVDKVLQAIDANNDSRRNLVKVEGKRAELEKSVGIHPAVWANELDIREVAVVRLAVSGNQEYVNLVRCGRRQIDSLVVSSGAPAKGGDYTPSVSEFRYKGMLSSLFGNIFSWAQEECSSFISGWLVIGSKAAVSEFVSGKALELNMERYLTDAGVRHAIREKSMLNVIVNISSDMEGISSVFKNPVASNMAANSTSDKINLVSYSLDKTRAGLIHRIDLCKSNYEIPVMSRYERDTTVEIPTGPWKVKNSGTGRTNLMYQQKNMYICLTEENGKGIWSAPFSSPICGNIDQVDYFENGKLQMIFASGDKLYLIDRLGRMVRPFPVSLGKDILLGPKVYDFNGNRKYNVMVLHKDNTLGLYDLQGNLREDWKGFVTDETIKSLPDLLEINSSLYWVVTTSMQTVICDFSGTPVADFSGSKSLRPGVGIKPVAGDVVEVETYNGKIWKLNLKTGVFSK